MPYAGNVHEATKHTPFSLTFGRKVQLPIDAMYGLPAGTGQPSQCTTLCLGAEEMDE